MPSSIWCYHYTRTAKANQPLSFGFYIFCWNVRDSAACSATIMIWIPKMANAWRYLYNSVWFLGRHAGITIQQSKTLISWKQIHASWYYTLNISFWLHHKSNYNGISVRLHCRGRLTRQYLYWPWQPAEALQEGRYIIVAPEQNHAISIITT